MKERVDNNKNNGSKPVGAALVVGAGIGGLEAAYDLAEAGIKVYLLENSPAIGGTITRLSTTFPTNTSPKCMLAPKLIEIGSHLNIETFTTAELLDVTGEPGHFHARVRKKPRYVSIDDCSGCGDCEAVCPEALPDEFNESLTERRAIYKKFPQAIPNAYAIDKLGVAPCRDACPIDQRAQGYIALVREGRFADAYRTIREENPFPSVCGRVCDHRCEDACLRGQSDSPVNIMALKRFVSDWARAHRDQIKSGLDKKPSASGKRVAVIGAGPAGLTCGLDLVRMGHAVTIFEALPVAGGMMRLGIPAFRLPHDLLQEEIDEIVHEGVEIRLNSPITDLPALLEEDYDAVFVAVGAHKDNKPSIPGTDLPQVLSGTDFLLKHNLRFENISSEKQKIEKDVDNVRGKRVLVLGSGAVAIHAAMTTLRLGADWVGIACLENREHMAAQDWEIQDAEEEGIQILPSLSIQEILEEQGAVSGVRCNRVDLKGYQNGIPDFTEIEGTEDRIAADVILLAVGREPELDFLKDLVEITPDRLMKVDPDTLATSHPAIFAGSETVKGTCSVVDAIAEGHRAAKSIQRSLLGQPLKKTELKPPVVSLNPGEILQRLADKKIAKAARVEMLARPPAERKHDFDEVYTGLTEEQAMQEAARCLRCGICSECNQCVYVCKANAIDHNQVEEILDLEVGAVILAPGTEVVSGSIRPEYGYGRYANVLTSMEFERMIHASSPFAGTVKRPSDDKRPKKVAWIQCVGSRDISCGQGYCSSVCCAYTTKQALVGIKRNPGIEPTIFYMDIRAYAKGYEADIERAEKQQGVRYIRSMVSAVKEVPGSKNLRVSYASFEKNGKPTIIEEEFEMVVLSLGLKPTRSTIEMAERLGIQLNEYGFAEPELYHAAESSRKGIYVAGAFAEPKDLTETVIEAGCAASKTSAALSGARFSLASDVNYPPERDVSEEEPRIGVFVCQCGMNIGAEVDTQKVVDFTQDLPDVVHAENLPYACSKEGREKIKEVITQQKLNRVVVAGCTPRTHEELFQNTIRQAGLNPYLFEQANIREQNAWAHLNQPEITTSKSKQLVSMAVSKARRLRSLQRKKLEIDKRALVIGGGLAGITAALSIADQGFPVFLVEKEDQLGGHLRHIKIGFNGSDPQQLLNDRLVRVSSQPLIHVLLESEVIEVSGNVGEFHTKVRSIAGEISEISHGVIIVATGAKEIRPKTYGYGQLSGVITQHELEENFDAYIGAESRSKSVVMIQCVGSRDDEHPYCSRICCSQAIKNALEIKKRQPETDVTILYRDIRTYGFREKYYQEARRAGVLFLEFDPDHPPQIQQASKDVDAGALQVLVTVQPEENEIRIESQLVVLSAGIEAEPGNKNLSQLLKLPLDEEHFFQEAHIKLQPADFSAEGIFLCGLAHSPRALDETLAHAQAASLKAVMVLAKKERIAMPIIAQVNPRLCSACGLCVEVCSYNARRLEPGMKYAEVIDMLCEGCGACVVACPNNATQQNGYEFLQITSMVDAALEQI